MTTLLMLFTTPTFRSFSPNTWLLIALLSAATLVNAQAQSGNPAGADGVALEQQWDEMVSESNRYQQYRVVPANWLNAMKGNMLDSMKAERAEISQLNSTIDKQGTEIEEQAENITSLQATITQLEKEKDGISLFGTIISKTAYNAFLWSLVGILLAGMLFFFGRGRYANAVTRELKANNTQLTEDLEKARRRRLEVEQDLRRKLQDEINKRNNQ